MVIFIMRFHCTIILTFVLRYVSLSFFQGYGLAMMVEVMCGILGGAHFGPNVRKWKTSHTVADLVSSYSIKHNLIISNAGLFEYMMTD